MSDETPTEPQGEHDKDQCDAPGQCAYHLLMAARVRAIQNDGQMYINAHDLSEFMQLWYGVEMSNAAESLRGVMSQEHISVALMNHNMASVRLSALVHGLAHEDIKPLSDADGTLVSPEEMKNVPDTVPTEWTHEKESQ